MCVPTIIEWPLEGHVGNTVWPRMSLRERAASSKLGSVLLCPLNYVTLGESFLLSGFNFLPNKMKIKILPHMPASGDLKILMNTNMVYHS